MFKAVSSLSALQVPPYILFKRRQGIRQFHPKTFIQVDAKKKKQIKTQFYCKYNQRLELVTKYSVIEKQSEEAFKKTVM